MKLNTVHRIMAVVSLFLGSVASIHAATITATYDSGLKAPRCSTVASGCSASTNGRGTMAGGIEINNPNTINGTCLDGNAGSYHVDESLDALSVVSVDGSDFSPGKTVRVDATVWAYSGFTSDKLDIYYSPNASTSTWNLIQTITPTKAGLQTLSTTLTLSSAPTQAVRASFRWGGTASSCAPGTYNDRDDLVFSVGNTQAPSGPTIAVTTPTVNQVVSAVSNISKISGTASSSTGIARVEISIDGRPFVIAQGTSMWAYDWNISAVTTSSHTIVARVTDTKGQTATSTVFCFTPFRISNIGKQVHFSSATITWYTNAITNSIITFGTTPTSFPLTISTQDRSNSHSILINGLNRGTTYYFRIHATDLYFHTTFSLVNSFQTKNSIPVISVTTPTANQAVDGVVSIQGIAQDQVGLYKLEVQIDSNPYIVTNWFLTDAPTTPQSWFYKWDTRIIPTGPHIIRARATNIAYTTATITLNVTTFSSPTINNINILNLNSTSAEINWTTPEASNSHVKYSTQPLSAFNPSFSGIGSSQLTTNHSLTLLGLNPNTTHYYIVSSVDSNGKERYSSQKTFRTLPDSLPVIVISTPAAGQTITGLVTVSGTASDDTGIIEIRFGLDNWPDFTIGAGNTWSYVLSPFSLINGPHTLQVSARDRAGNISRASLPFIVQNPSKGNAVYDAQFKAPYCRNESTACNSGNLLWGRGFMENGAEFNAPNTINNSCSDGNAGRRYTDESLESLIIETVDGSVLSTGKIVYVRAYLWPSATRYSSDKLDIYYATNASSPTWSLISTLSVYSGGVSYGVVSSTFTLGNGNIQAIRGHFRNGGSPSICSTGMYDDRDDLVFYVTPSATGPNQATYDPVLLAPKCGTVGSTCNTGTLVNGRGTISNGIELNRPNTIKNSCPDGNSGTYHADESIDAITVRTLDGSSFAPGKIVSAEFTVWAYGAYSIDNLDIYYTTNASSPTWTFLNTVKPTKAGFQVLSSTFTLGTTGLQAVRGNFRDSGVPSTCSTGIYDERDDLIFAVGQTAQSQALKQGDPTALTAAVGSASVIPPSSTVSKNVLSPTIPTESLSGSVYQPTVNHPRYYPSQHGPLHFKGFPPNTLIRITTAGGELLQTIQSGIDGSADWNATGAQSGIYLGFAEYGNRTYRVKFVIIR